MRAGRRSRSVFVVLIREPIPIERCQTCGRTATWSVVRDHDGTTTYLGAYCDAHVNVSLPTMHEYLER